MRLALLFVLVAAAFTAHSADGAWVAFVREGNRSVAFERSSMTATNVNLLTVSPKGTTGTLVYSWEIKTQVHQFDCANRTYRLLTKKFYDEAGAMTNDETAVVKAMNDAFPDRAHPLDTEALRKAYALVCAKSEPAPAKPFASINEALAWMAN